MQGRIRPQEGLNLASNDIELSGGVMKKQAAVRQDTKSAHRGVGVGRKATAVRLYSTMPVPDAQGQGHSIPGYGRRLSLSNERGEHDRRQRPHL